MSIFKFNQVAQSSKMQKVVSYILYILLIILGISSVVSDNIGLIPLVVFSAALMFVQPYLDSKKNTRQSKKLLLGTLGILSAGLYHLTSSSIHIQLFKNVEEFFISSSNVTQGTGTISTIFTILRTIYMIYIVISLVGIFNSVRKNEDWMTRAQIPLIIFTCVCLISLLSRLILKVA